MKGRHTTVQFYGLFMVMIGCSPTSTMPPPMAAIDGNPSMTGVAGSMGNPNHCSYYDMYCPIWGVDVWHIFHPKKSKFANTHFLRELELGVLGFYNTVSTDIPGTEENIGGGLLFRGPLIQNDLSYVGLQMSGGVFWANVGIPMSRVVHRGSNTVSLYITPSVTTNLGHYMGDFRVQAGVAFELSTGHLIYTEINERYGYGGLFLEETYYSVGVGFPVGK